MKINTVNIVEVSQHGGVEWIQSYDANYYHTAERDFEDMILNEYPDWHYDMVADAFEAGCFNTKSGNTVCLVRSKK